MIRVVAAALSFSFFLVQPANALEIPKLTWERGKAQNVVLGGNSENLAWDVFLVDESGIALRFDASRANSADFLVYSLSLPRSLPLGSYEVVARITDTRANESDRTVAAVEVVERFQFNLLEIPRDFLFILLCYLMFVSIQLNVRFWRVRKDDLAKSLAWSEFGTREQRFSYVTSALLRQRLRWQDRWLGSEVIPTSVGELREVPRAYLPLISALISLYLGVGGFLLGSASALGAILFGGLALISVLDRYSAKIATLALFTTSIVFNATINLPSLTALTLLILMLLIPQYVADVARQFIRDDFGSKQARVLLQNGFPALGAGISVFWLYLVSESITFASSTDGTSVTPIAIAASLGAYLRQSTLFSNTVSSESSELAQQALVLVQSRSASLVVWPISNVIFYIWTGNLFVSTALGTLVSASGLAIHLRLERTRSLRFALLRSSVIQIAIVVIFFVGSHLVISDLPLVVLDRAIALLWIFALIVAAYSLFKLVVPGNSELRTESDLEEARER